MYLPLCKVADTPFHIQVDDVGLGLGHRWQRLSKIMDCCAHATGRVYIMSGLDTDISYVYVFDSIFSIMSLKWAVMCNTVMNEIT